MPTPVSQQIVRDSFTRANSGTLGANWTALSDATDTQVLGITSNAAQPQVTGGRAASFWNANTFSADQYAQCITNGSATGTNAHLAGPTVRTSAGGNYYLLQWNMAASGTANLTLNKCVGGVFSQVGGTPATNPSVLGSLLRLEVVGSLLSAYVDGNLVFQVTDTDLTTGAPGVSGFMAAASPTAFATNFEGGNLVWTRRGTAIPIGATGTEEPAVIYEANPKILTANADGKIFKMWYGIGWTVNTIGYAESNDGISWTLYGSNPVISDGANNVGHGFVMKNGSTYYGFFCTDAQSASNMNRWTSPDGITWTKTNSSVLPLGTAGQWDSGGLFNPVVWVESGTWYMLYNGRNGVQYSIGLATSPDGIVWTKYASNPVITSAGTSAEGKTVVKSGNTYYLWGFTSPTGNLPTDNALWSSPDLHAWTACAKNPIYQRVLLDEGANLAAGQIGDPVLVELNGTTYMYYDAVNLQSVGHFHINVATAPYSLLQITGMIFGSFIISGSVGLAGATVNYSGPASGSVIADVFGNYVIPVSTNGTYTITPSGSFTPSSLPAVVSSADVAAINFTVSGSGPGTIFDAKPIPVTLVNSSGYGLAFASPTVSGNNGEPTPVCFTDANGNEYASSGATVGGELGQGTPVVLCNAAGQPIVPPFAFTTNATTITWAGTLSGRKLGQPTPVVLTSGAGFLYGLTGLTEAGVYQSPTPVVLTDANGNILTGIIGV